MECSDGAKDFSYNFSLAGSRLRTTRRMERRTLIFPTFPQQNLGQEQVSEVMVLSGRAVHN